MVGIKHFYSLFSLLDFFVYFYESEGVDGAGGSEGDAKGAFWSISALLFVCRTSFMNFSFHIDKIEISSLHTYFGVKEGLKRQLLLLINMHTPVIGLIQIALRGKQSME